MKQFVNKVTEITRPKEGGGTKNMTYAELAIVTLNIPTSEAGFSVTEMRTRIKLEDKLDNQDANAIIALDDSDVAKLKACANINWRIKHRDVLSYVDYLESLVKEV